jgi:hypothetical protein
MDERAFESSLVTTDRQRQQAIDYLQRQKTYEVVVLGEKNAPDEWLTIKACDSDERVAKMSEAGIDLQNNKWAAGYLDGNRNPQVCYNNDEARGLVERHLRKR